MGDIDESIIDILNQHLQFPENNKDYPSAYSFDSQRQDVLEIIEEQDLTQSKLNMGYRIGCDFTSNHHYAIHCF
ncbi:MAG: hypothetical protein ACLSBH_14600 [Coprobacillus cateniformis]